MNQENASNSPKNETDIYYNCCLYEKGVCRSFMNIKTLIEGIEDVGLLTNSVEEYLRNGLRYKESLELTKWTEKTLIENRLGRHFQAGEKICPHHRFRLGTKFQPSSQCSHPLHELVKSGGKKSTKTYRMSFSMINKLNSINPFSYKLGAQMCKKHELIIKANQESSANQILEEDDYMICDVSFQDDPYVPPVYPVDNDTSIEDLTNISRKFGVSPVKYKLSKPIDEVCRSNQRYFKRKRAQFLLGAQNHFDQTFAPGQPTERVKEVLGEEQGNSIPKDLYSLVENYEKSDSFGKLSILSIVDHKKHSKAELMKYFHCSKRKIEQARALQVKEEGVHSKEIVTFKRNRMNTEKCEHFLNFLFSSGLIQDVAYGMTNIKFDSGDVQSIPHTILQTKFSHTIDFYNTSCSELN